MLKLVVFLALAAIGLAFPVAGVVMILLAGAVIVLGFYLALAGALGDLIQRLKPGDEKQ